MIVHVTPSYPPRLGGLEKVVQMLATTQAQAGLRTAVLTSDQAAHAGTITEDIPVTRLRSFVLASTNVIPALLFRLLKLKKTDIVHLHVTQAYTPEMVWLASKIKGFSYVAHIHLDVTASGKAGFLLKIYKPLLLRRVLQSAKAVIVFTRDQKRHMSQKYSLKPDRVHVIPNGVEPKFFMRTTHTPHSPLNLLFVGRLGYQKNLQQLLHALDGMSKDFKTTLVGSDELHGELQQLAARLKLKNVSFPGRADGDALLDYYKNADAFVLPSEREGMPLVLLEAMAMGLPVVATNVTGNRDIVTDGVNGLLVPYADAEALATALQRLRQDRTLYDKLQRASLVTAKKYSWRTIVTMIGQVYET